MNEVVKKVLEDTATRKERHVEELRAKAQEDIERAKDMHEQALVLEMEARALRSFITGTPLPPGVVVDVAPMTTPPIDIGT